MKVFGLAVGLLVYWVGLVHAANPRPFENAYFQGVTDKNPVGYHVGEEIVFTLVLKDAEAFPDDSYFLKWTAMADDDTRLTGTVSLIRGKPFVHRGKIGNPGFYGLRVDVVDRDGNPYQRLDGTRFNTKSVTFRGGAAADPDKMKTAAEPADFDVFWERRRARLTQCRGEVRRTTVRSPDPKVDVWAVQIPCAGPRPVTGHLSIPRCHDGGLPAELTLDGYGDGARRHELPPISVPLDRIVLHINAHGYELGREDEYYRQFAESIKSNGKLYAHDPEQNRDPEKSYFSGMSFRVMCALEFLSRLPEWNRRDLWTSGSSQGGLQALWGAALDSRVTRCTVQVPWCCDLGGVTLHRFRGGQVPWVEALAYYDPVFLARRIPRTCFVDIARVGLGDPTSPPSSIGVLWNNLRCPARIVWVQGSDHGFVPPEPRQEIEWTRK